MGLHSYAPEHIVFKIPLTAHTHESEFIAKCILKTHVYIFCANFRSSCKHQHVIDPENSDLPQRVRSRTRSPKSLPRPIVDAAPFIQMASLRGCSPGKTLISPLLRPDSRHQPGSGNALRKRRALPLRTRRAFSSGRVAEQNQLLIFCTVMSTSIMRLARVEPAYPE